jgi:hypothetical protein
MNRLFDLLTTSLVQEQGNQPEDSGSVWPATWLAIAFRTSTAAPD